MPVNLNGERVKRRNSTIFVQLPRRAWRPCGTCSCPHCKGGAGFWDTLAIANAPPKDGNDTTWLVHMPENHPYHDRTSDGRFYTEERAVMTEQEAFAEGARHGHANGRGRAGLYVTGEECFAAEAAAGDQHFVNKALADAWFSGYGYGYRLAAEGSPLDPAFAVAA